MQQPPLIKYNLKERGRQHRGTERHFDIPAIVGSINSPATQERVATRGMLGYFGHWPRLRFGMEPAEGGLADGKAHAVEPTVVTTHLKAFDDGTIEHQTEFLDTATGQLASRMYANRVGGFSTAIDPRKPELFGFDWVNDPNYSTNRSYDLAQFRHNARVAGRRFKGGITARQVIDMSLFNDRKRARQQIKMAVPAGARGTRGSNRQVEALEVRFITNAGPDSDQARHHVVVEFLGYQTAIASGAHSAFIAAGRLRKEPIRFDCDCGRHRYWFRYIATIGRYNAGRSETGYPKIRNPKLYGVACKHVLRVMAEIEGGSAVQAFLPRAIEKGRQSEDGSGHIRQRQKEAEQLAEKQSRRPSHGSSGDRDFDRSRRALIKQSRATTTKPKRTAKGSRKVQALGGHAQRT